MNLNSARELKKIIQKEIKKKIEEKHAKKINKDFIPDLLTQPNRSAIAYNMGKMAIARAMGKKKNIKNKNSISKAEIIKILEMPDLGIVKVGKNDYQIGFRIQRQSNENYVEFAKKITKGEINIKKTGRIQSMINWREFFLGQNRYRKRPIHIGTSISVQNGSTGTLGCFVTCNNAQNKIFLLSNNHVIADLNEAEENSIIIQPGEDDGGRIKIPKDIIATLARYKEIRLNSDIKNTVDAAVAELNLSTNQIILENYRNIPFPRGISEPISGSSVIKYGRSGLTRGSITGFEFTVKIDFSNYGERIIGIFDNAIEIEDMNQNNPFCHPGDSGSLIMNSGKLAIGLLMARSSSKENKKYVTYANPIQDVLNSLEIELIVDKNN